MTEYKVWCACGKSAVLPDEDAVLSWAEKHSSHSWTVSRKNLE